MQVGTSIESSYWRSKNHYRNYIMKCLQNKAKGKKYAYTPKLMEKINEVYNNDDEIAKNRLVQGICAIKCDVSKDGIKHFNNCIKTVIKKI